MQELIKDQESILDKLDDLELRSRQSNLQIYRIQEETESKCDLVTMFVDKWLKEEISIDSDLQIQRAHRTCGTREA